MNANVLLDKDLIIKYQLVIYIMMLSGYKGVAYYVAFMFVTLIAAGIAYKNKGKLPTNKSWNSFILFLIFYWFTSIVVSFDRRNFFTYLVYYTLCFFPILMAEDLKRESDKKWMIKSIKCFTGVFVGFCVIAIIYYIINPGTARLIASHQVEERLAIGGGYSLAYAAAVFGVYLFSKKINGRLKGKRYVFSLIAIFVWVVFLTESTITLFAMLIGFVVAIITRNDEKSHKTVTTISKWIAISVLIFIVLIIVMGSKYEIAEFILDFSEGRGDELIYRRITETIDKLVYGKSTYHVAKRSNTLLQSIEVFKKYPLFGMGYKYGYVYSLGTMYGMGQHSEILDAIARFGIIGGSLWLTPYFVTIKQIFKRNFGCVVTILMMMYFNPFLSFHSNAIMFFVIPLIEELLRRRDEEKDKEVDRVSN